MGRSADDRSWQAGEVITLTSPNGTGRCTIAPDVGGRIESLVVSRSIGAALVDTELLITRHSPSVDPTDPYSWGCFTMVPFCGRVREATFTFEGTKHHLEARVGPHAMHGTVVERPWVVLKMTASSALLGCELGPRWPFAGMVHHEISIDDHGLSMILSLSATEAMPAQVGWHPWFRRPVSYALPFGGLLERDRDGIATSRQVPFDRDERNVFDDCFVEATGPITMRIDNVDVSLESDCAYWTVFDRPAHGICVEPQSGPPNGINDHPEALISDDRLSRWFRITWDIGPDD